MGIKQIHELKSDKDEWTNNYYEGLENILRDFIPLIRFSDISSDDL